MAGRRVESAPFVLEIDMPLIPHVGRKKLSVRLQLLAVAAVLWLGVAIHCFPIWYMLASSLKTTEEILNSPMGLVPEEPTTASYKLLFRTLSNVQESQLFRYPMSTYFKNSIVLTFSTMALQLPVIVLLAYAVSRLHVKRTGRWVFLFCIGTMMIPGQIATVPRFLLLSHFPWPTRYIPHVTWGNFVYTAPHVNLVGSLFGVILPSVYNAFNFLILKGFFDTLPQDLIEASRLDGCSELGVLRHVVIPLSAPVIAVVLYFSFRAAWNNFMGPLIILMGEQDKWPLALALYKLGYFLHNWTPTQGGVDPETQKLIASGVGFNALMALSVVQSIPVFVVFMLFREQVMRGVKLQGFK
jgi:ABC-type glycerol-3-phosphate transport system permease component